MPNPRFNETVSANAPVRVIPPDAGRPGPEAAMTPTRLKRLEPEYQERLINWGFAVCDAALRKHVDAALPAPGGFPYSGTGV